MKGDTVMAKKVLAWIGVVILSLFVLYNAFFIYSTIENGKKEVPVPYGKEGDLIPIEQITGIYTQATLKPGCYIDFGISIPSDDNGPWHNSCVGAEESGGLHVDDIWIVDVYGDQCTVVFTLSDASPGQHNLYSDTKYPLSNLDYDQSKVEKADDGLEVSLYGSRYTLNKTARASFAVGIVMALCIEGGALAGIILLVHKVIKPRR